VGPQAASKFLGRHKADGVLPLGAALAKYPAGPPHQRTLALLAHQVVPCHSERAHFEANRALALCEERRNRTCIGSLLSLVRGIRRHGLASRPAGLAMDLLCRNALRLCVLLDILNGHPHQLGDGRVPVATTGSRARFANGPRAHLSMSIEGCEHGICYERRVEAKGGEFGFFCCALSVSASWTIVCC
jgi:hypothetical protein